MPCLCEKCGNLTMCRERLCSLCFLDTLDDPVEKNLFLGGNFYEEYKEDLSTSVDADGIT